MPKHGETVQFKGVVKWASVLPGQAKKVLGKEGSTEYVIDVECTQEQLNELFKKGVDRRTLLRDDTEKQADGSYKVVSDKKFIRVRNAKTVGEYDFGDIPVRMADGTEVTQPIANGSEALVTASIDKDTSKKTGLVYTAMRLRAVVLTKYVPFSKETTTTNVGENPYAKEEAHSQDLNSSNDW